MKRIIGFLVSVVLASIAAISIATPALAYPAQVCTGVGPGNPQQVVHCPVRVGTWVDFQAYLDIRVTDQLGGPVTGTARFRVQVEARRGSTSTIIQGLWLVYVSGPKPRMAARIDTAQDSNCHRKAHGPWNYQGTWNGDTAARGSNSDIIRWPAVSPAAPIGIVTSAQGPCTAKLAFQVVVHNNDGSDPDYSAPQAEIWFELK